MDDKTDAVRRRAYAIWQEEGQPDGEDAAHWHRAERELADAAIPADDADDPVAGGVLSEGSAAMPAYPHTNAARPAGDSLADEALTDAAPAKPRAPRRRKPPAGS